MSDARHQPSQRGQLLGLHETVLRGAEILERLRQLPRALLHLGEQPRVLDGDDRLTGEGFQETRPAPWGNNCGSSRMTAMAPIATSSRNIGTTRILR